MESKQKQPGLYEPRFEHDNCGIGETMLVVI